MGRTTLLIINRDDEINKFDPEIHEVINTISTTEAKEVVKNITVLVSTWAAQAIPPVKIAPGTIPSEFQADVNNYLNEYYDFNQHDIAYRWTRLQQIGKSVYNLNLTPYVRNETSKIYYPITDPTTVNITDTVRYGAQILVHIIFKCKDIRSSANKLNTLKKVPYY